MDILEQGVELFKKIPRAYYLPIGIGCIGLILLVFGSLTFLQKNQNHENSDFVDFSQSSVKQSTASNEAQLNVNTIVVDVEGAVVSPGIYTVKQDGRVQDALVAAGGLSANADRQWVAQHIDLAIKLTDGTKIYIPTIGEVAVVQSSGQVGNTAVLGAQSQQININSASATDLDNLPGVGPATANKIIAGRPYGSVEDLLNRKIVSAKTFAKIKDLVTAN